MNSMVNFKKNIYLTAILKSKLIQLSKRQTNSMGYHRGSLEKDVRYGV